MFGVWAPPAAPKNIPEGGGFAPHLLECFFGAAGAAPTLQIKNSRPVQKACIKNPSVSIHEVVWGSGLLFTRWGVPGAWVDPGPGPDPGSSACSSGCVLGASYSNAVKKAFRLLFRSKNLGFGVFSGPNRPPEDLEKAPGSGSDRFASFFSPVDQF